MRSVTKLELQGLSANLVELGFKNRDSSRPRLLAMVIRSLVWMK